MYNYQAFLKQQSLQKQIQSLRKKHQIAQVKRESSSPALIHAHKKRVEGFVLSVIDKPIPVTQYRNNSPSFRTTNREGILGSKGFYLRRQSQPERIENQLKKNSSLDYVPFTNTFSHHFRQTHGGGMHYEPFTHNFRIRQYLDSQPLNYLPNTTLKPDKIIKKQKNGQKVDVQKLNSSLNKNLLPILHQKTYFKSVSTLFNEIPSRLNKSQIAVSNEEGTEQTEQKKLVKPIEHLSRKQNSRQALLKCNMLREKLRG